MSIICVDGGHGDPDPGAVSKSGIKEADVTLLAAHCLKDELQKYGHNVVLTRWGTSRLVISDRNRDLDRRCEIANNEKAHCFVSIHCNSVDNPNAHGWEIFHAPGSVKGKQFAEIVQRAMHDSDIVLSPGESPVKSPEELKDRGVKANYLRVLKKTIMPAVLIELAFLSNPKEESKLRDPVWITKKAKAMAQGVNKWLVEMKI